VPAGKIPAGLCRPSYIAADQTEYPSKRDFQQTKAELAENPTFRQVQFQSILVPIYILFSRWGDIILFIRY